MSDFIAITTTENYDASAATTQRKQLETVLCCFFTIVAVLGHYRFVDVQVFLYGEEVSRAGLKVQMIWRRCATLRTVIQHEVARPEIVSQCQQRLYISGYLLGYMFTMNDRKVTIQHGKWIAQDHQVRGVRDSLLFLGKS